MKTTRGDALAYGQSSETLAVRHLRKKGYKIITCNYRNKLGEIDIVARHKGTLVFVEVKARRSDRYGDPKWAVSPAKQHKLTKVALAYLKQHHSLQAPARFDVVSIKTTGGHQRIEVITNAFEPVYP